MTLQAEYEACMNEFDHAVLEITDFDGIRKTVYKDGWENIANRMSMIEDLMELKKPVYETDWGTEIHFGLCPCPNLEEV